MIIFSLVQILTIIGNYFEIEVHKKLFFTVQHSGTHYSPILDSERSDECIDSTMMCFFFFVSDDNIWSSKNASILDFSPSLKRKLNLIGTLGGSKVKNFQYFLNESGKTLKK
jgi:hypothetical protein